MMTFLERNSFSSEAVEGIMEIIFGDLTPIEAIRLDRECSGLNDKDKMGIILKHLFCFHFKNIH